MAPQSTLLDVDRAESAFRLLFCFAWDEADSDHLDTHFQSVVREILRGVKLPDGAMEKLRRIHKDVAIHPSQLDRVLPQVVKDFSDDRGLLISIVMLLLRITSDEGMISRRHREELQGVLRAFQLSFLELEDFSDSDQELLTYILVGQQSVGGTKELLKNYQILGCAPDATDDQIRQAYRGLAKTHHPDRQNHSARGEPRSRAGEEFRLVQDAYDSVCKARRRV